MTNSPKGDHVRERAQRFRELARMVSAPEIKAQMERLAVQYDQLANVEERDQKTGGISD